MEEPHYPALNTKEFIAKWHSALEQHLIAELAEVLPRLAHRAAAISGQSNTPRWRTTWLTPYRWRGALAAAVCRRP